MYPKMNHAEVSQKVIELTQLPGKILIQVAFKAIREQLELERNRIRARCQGIGSALKALAAEYEALPKNQKP